MSSELFVSSYVDQLACKSLHTDVLVHVHSVWIYFLPGGVLVVVACILLPSYWEMFTLFNHFWGMYSHIRDTAFLAVMF